ncbi:FitA-like ribbon-helix-helix domain-containing protein [Microbacterium sp.]|uniref:FitA-like ribbon-helix-helix domain-containing protein n=1 Tax=Microbacterium sp. TaxID=51671 RepID=UPI003F9940C6
MAAITIRNLPDEVVEALKQRATKNSRSMEAEVREALTRLAAGDDPATSGLERVLADRYRTRRWSTTGDEIEARLAANPPTEEDLHVAANWLTEHNARPYDDADAWEDPWMRAERQRETLRRQQGESA